MTGYSYTRNQNSIFADPVTTGLLATISNPNNDTITYSLISDTVLGLSSGSSLALINGQLIYKPGRITSSDIGTDTLQYIVTDTTSGLSTGTITQTVTLGPGPAPTVTAATGTITANNAATATLGTALPGFGNAYLSGYQTADNGLFTYISTDDSVRGTLVAQTNNWGNTARFTNAALVAGVTNYLHIEMIDYGGPGGLIGTYTLTGGATFANGSTTLSTDAVNWKSVIQSNNGTYAEQPWVTPTNTPIVVGTNGSGPWGTRANIASTAAWLNDPNTGSAANQGSNYNGGFYTIDFSVPINVRYPNGSPDTLSVSLVSDAAFSSGSSVSLGTSGIAGTNIVYTPGVVTTANAGTTTVAYAVRDTVTGTVTTKTTTVALSNAPAPMLGLVPQPTVSNGGSVTVGSATAYNNTDALSIALVSDDAFSQGTSGIGLSGSSIVYTPGTFGANKVGTDRITYTVTDTVTGAATTTTQNVTLAYTAAPSVAQASSPSATNTSPATLGTVTAANNGDSLAVALNSDAAFGSGSSIALQGSSIIYTPGMVTALNTGSDSLSYTVTETHAGATTSTTITQTVTLSNAPDPVVTLAATPQASNAGPVTVATAVAGWGGHALSATLLSDAVFTSGSSVSYVGGRIVYTPGAFTGRTAGADAIGFAVTDLVTGARTTETQVVTNLATPAATSVVLDGWHNNVGTPVTAMAGGTAAGAPVTGPDSGNAVVTGTSLSEVVTARGWGNTVFGAGGDDLVYAGQGAATVAVNDGDGNVTVSGSKGNTTIRLGSGNDLVQATGWNNTVILGDGDNMITGLQGNTTLTVGSGSNTIALSGFNNVITAGDGDNTLSGAQGNDTITAGNGSNTLMLGGYGDTVMLGDGDNTISGLQGSARVTVGNGSNLITLAGFGNFVTTGSGSNTITAGAGSATVDTGSGSDTVMLAGWNNLVLGGAGHSVISGGMGNIYRATGLGTTGGMDIQDFSTGVSDRLDLHTALASAGYAGSHLELFLAVATVGADAQVSLARGGSSYVVATLRGNAGLTLSSLLSHNGLTV